MKFDTTGIEGYAEMSAEDKVKAFEAFEFEAPKADETEITNLKQLLSKRNGEIADIKRQLKAKSTDEENEAAEKAQKMSEMEAELTELRKQNSLNKYKAQYLGKAGFDEKLAAEMAEAMVNGELDKVSDIMAKASETAEKQIKAKLLAEAGKEPPAGDKKGKEEDKKTVAEGMAEQIGKNISEANKRSADILARYIK